MSATRTARGAEGIIIVRDWSGPGTRWTWRLRHKGTAVECITASYLTKQSARAGAQRFLKVLKAVAL